MYVKHENVNLEEKPMAGKAWYVPHSYSVVKLFMLLFSNHICAHLIYR